MRKLCFAALLFLLAPLAALAEQQHAAVLEFELGPDVKKVDRTYLSDRARSALHDAAPRLFIMTRESTEALLQANGKSMADCGGECEVEVGRKLGADFIVSGRITQFGSRILVTMRLFSTIDGQLLSSAEARGENLDKLLDAMDGALAKLLVPLAQAAPPPPTPAQAAPAAPASAQAADPAAVSHWRGGRGALVTIVEYGGFQCPFCLRVEPALRKLAATYKDRIKLVWKNDPLPFHNEGVPSAKAALAAGLQGKFWEMHDLLFEHQTELASGKYEDWARQLGLDLTRFKSDFASAQLADALKRDQDEVALYGVNGTPAFLINGKWVSGAQQYEVFTKVIDEQLAEAADEEKRGTPKDSLYGVLFERHRKQWPPPAAPKPETPDAGPPVQIELGDSPVRGGRDAKVTLVEFGDFQCPFTKRVEPVLVELSKLYGDRLALVWKNEPLAMHAQAMPAAQAAMAAGEQGKFWEMHDRLFADQKELSPELYERAAGELGLDVAAFRAALSSSKTKDAIDADAKLGLTVSNGATPTFFINGHKLVGAQPIEVFKKAIDAELAK